MSTHMNSSNQREVISSTKSAKAICQYSPTRDSVHSGGSCLIIHSQLFGSGHIEIESTFYMPFLNSIMNMRNFLSIGVTPHMKIHQIFHVSRLRKHVTRPQRFTNDQLT